MKIPNEVLQVLKYAAPTLATALVGPLGGAAATVAVSALEKYLGQPLADHPVAVTPADIVSVVQKNINDPEFLLRLKIAEMDIKKYEGDLDFKFAELVVKEKEITQEFQTENQLARPLLHWGMAIVCLSLGSLLAVVVGSLLLIAGFVAIPAETVQMAVGVFGLIGAITGTIGGYAIQIINFYWSDNQGSQRKTEALTTALQTSGAQLGEAAAAASVTASKAAATAATEAAKPVPVPQVVVVPPPPVTVPGPSPAPVPAPTSTGWKQGPFGGARWQVVPEGVLVEGDAGVARTVGAPITVRRAWALYGQQMMAECLRRGVPVEIGMMVLCTESGSKLNAAATLTEPDARVSSGIMQVLTGTASDMLGRAVTVDELKNPAISIEAGVRYIQHQKSKTWFDPILTAAAYNAGGLYEPRPQDDNRFNLRSTGDHIERAIRWYGDICFVAKEDGWFK